MHVHAVTFAPIQCEYSGLIRCEKKNVHLLSSFMPVDLRVCAFCFAQTYMRCYFAVYIMWSQCALLWSILVELLYNTEMPCLPNLFVLVDTPFSSCKSMLTHCLNVKGLCSAFYHLLNFAQGLPLYNRPAVRPQQRCKLMTQLLKEI